MAKDDERPTFNPKHRIAGAIILVSLAVIFVPMLLEESTPPKSTQSLTEIPARGAGGSDTKVVITPVPPPEPARTQIADTATETPLPSTSDRIIAEAKVEALPPESATGNVAAVEKKTDSASGKSKQVSAKSSDIGEKLSQGWVVQVGTFSNAENATRLRDKLTSHGYVVNSEYVTTASGAKAMRLRVGPYHDKPAAARAQTQLQKDLSIQGMVLASP